MAGEINGRIEQLRRQIRGHDHLYYVLHQPEITDRQYDELFAELKILEAEHPELVTPDSPAPGGFCDRPARHAHAER